MNRLVTLVTLVALTACASKTPSAPVSPADEAPMPPSAPVSPADEPPMPPFADQMPVDKPIEEAPAAKPLRNSCADEIAIVCDEGFVDGCGLRNVQGQSLTLNHVCVAAEAKPGPPCAQELAADCAEGFEDACMTSPPLSFGHVCVQSR